MFYILCAKNVKILFKHFLTPVYRRNLLKYFIKQIDILTFFSCSSYDKC